MFMHGFKKRTSLVERPTWAHRPRCDAVDSHPLVSGNYGYSGYLFIFIIPVFDSRSGGQLGGEVS
jgi:hypothetical protein